MTRVLNTFPRRVLALGLTSTRQHADLTQFEYLGSRVTTRGPRAVG